VTGSLVIGDWGNSRLRLWRLENGTIADRREGPGMSRIDAPQAALARLLDGWAAEQVILCGMAGARGGLHETPYVCCPADRADWSGGRGRFDLAGRTIILAPGIAGSNDDGRPDVMRGEETQVFGAMALDPDMSAGRHLVVLPGTHSKWVSLEDGRITGFDTHMTGEMFALLGASTLCLADAAVANDDDVGFAAGLARSTEGSALTASLFEARAAQLREGRSPGWARGFVSGLLIGTETRAETMSGPTSVIMIGDPLLTARYKEALAHWSVNATIMDGEECAIAGLRLLDADD
jgi:2-dehydro-3-deoxygalactonokinase